MKRLLIALSLLMAQNLWAASCYHIGDGVSFSFQSCVNHNFTRLGNELGVFTSYCSNYGDQVSFSFTSCVEGNFRSLERGATGHLYLSYCANYDRDSLSYSFVSCSNRNFNEVERYLRSVN